MYFTVTSAVKGAGSSIRTQANQASGGFESERSPTDSTLPDLCAGIDVEEHHASAWME